MSGLVPNSITLYLRPAAAIQPYRINDCARWLVTKGKFDNYTTARLWLNTLESSHPFQFKAIMSEYFDETDYKQDYMSKRDVNKYHTGNDGSSYGEEEHMYWSF